MTYYLLIARFTFDDVPLRLFGSPFWAHEEAKQLDGNPSLLETKWIDSLRAWPASKGDQSVLGDFVGAMVLKINRLSGYPKEVTYDSTLPTDAKQVESVQPVPAEASLPDGCVEITDPNHKLRPYVDLYLSKTLQEWMLITETDAVLIGDWSDSARFCCPATLHPDFQGDSSLGIPEAPTDHLPDGCIEITDPNHNLRAGIDCALDVSDPKGKWSVVQRGLVGDNAGRYRFCCPATHHPDLQGASIPAETDELKVLREANEILVKKQVELVDRIEIFRKANADLLAENNTLVATRTQLHKTVGELLEERSEWMANNAPALESRYKQCERHAEELQAANAILKKDNDDLRSSNIAFGKRNAANQAEILSLQTEVGSLRAQMQGFTLSAVERSEKDEQAFGILRAQNSDLHRLNEDLNQRLNATLARASHATDLEARIRVSAINLVKFHAKLHERRVWSSVFAAERQMPQAYTEALLTVDGAFTDIFLSFLQSFPHVQPDMPDEWQIDFEAAAADDDDDDGMAD